MGSAPILPILLMFLGAIKLAGSSTTTADGSTLTSSSPSSIGSTTNGDLTVTTGSTSFSGSATPGVSTSIVRSTNSKESTKTPGSTPHTLSPISNGSSSTASTESTGGDASTTTVGSSSFTRSTNSKGSTTTRESTLTSRSTGSNGMTTTSGSTRFKKSTTSGSSQKTTGSTGGLVTTDGSVTPQATTRPGDAGGAVTTAATKVVVVAATLVKPFVEELNNPNSTQYKTLARLIVSVCDLIYRRKFGFIFIRTYIRGFRGVVARTRMENIQAEVGLVFNNTVSPAQIPKDDVVIATLAEAVNTPNSLNLTIVPNSIQIIGSPTKAPTTPVTTAKTPATTAAEKLTKRRLTFRSAGEIFKNDLLNPSSSAFVNRATLIKQTLEPNYQKAFSSFRFLNVIMFRNGSIINTMDLQFASTSVPNGTQIADVLIGAASNITAFNIETTSISVDGIQVSHGVKHRISVLTATLLVLLSWLLPRLH